MLDENFRYGSIDRMTNRVAVDNLYFHPKEWLQMTLDDTPFRKENDSHAPLSLDFNSAEIYRCCRNSLPFDPGVERVIEISEVDKIIGTWQKEQYESLGVTRIRLSSDGVTFELKEPKQQRIGLASSLEFGTTFSFKFTTNDNGWSLYDLAGLKLNDSTVTKMEADAEKLIFWMGDESSEFGSSHADYIKALLNPLMKEDLHK